MRRTGVTAAVGGLLLLVAGAAADDQPILSDGQSGPPEEISGEIRAALDSEGPMVTLASGTTLEFWFRGEQPAGGPSGRQGATFPDLDIGSLVGTVRIAGPWSDYKGNPIEPGTFTLRYGMRPEDGNHMGVSVHLDFVLLVPVAEDATLEVEWGQDDLNIMSFAATGIGHPAIMSLAPNWDGASEAVIFEDDSGGWALAWPWSGGLVLGFVVEGEGEH